MSASKSVCYCVCLSVSLCSMCMLVRHDALFDDGADVHAVMHGREDRSHNGTHYRNQVSRMPPLPKRLVSFAPYPNHLPEAHMSGVSSRQWTCFAGLRWVGSLQWVRVIKEPPPHIFFV